MLATILSSTKRPKKISWLTRGDLQNEIVRKFASMAMQWIGNTSHLTTETNLAQRALLRSLLFHSIQSAEIELIDNETTCLQRMFQSKLTWQKNAQFRHDVNNKINEYIYSALADIGHMEVRYKNLRCRNISIEIVSDCEDFRSSLSSSSCWTPMLSSSPSLKYFGTDFCRRVSAICDTLSNILWHAEIRRVYVCCSATVFAPSSNLWPLRRSFSDRFRPGRDDTVLSHCVVRLSRPRCKNISHLKNWPFSIRRLQCSGT